MTAIYKQPKCQRLRQKYFNVFTPKKVRLYIFKNKKKQPHTCGHSVHCVLMTPITTENCIHHEKMVSSKSCLTDSSWIYVVLVSHSSTLFVFNFFFPPPDSSGTKGERLSAKLKALPGTREPYESNSSKEIGKWASSTFLLSWPSKREEMEKISSWKSMYN